MLVVCYKGVERSVKEETNVMHLFPMNIFIGCKVMRRTEVETCGWVEIYEGMIDVSATTMNVQQ